MIFGSDCFYPFSLLIYVFLVENLLIYFGQAFFGWDPKYIHIYVPGIVLFLKNL